MTTVSQTNVSNAGWRLKLGIVLLCLSILLPLIGVPLLAIMGLPTATVATASGALLVSAEVLGLVAVAVMGKSGYAYIKNRFFGFLKQHGPPQKVSRGRYNIGLVLFGLPLLFGWLSLYISKWIPGLLNTPLPYAIAGDILMVSSLVVLGGDFWDKIRSVFIHNAEVNFIKNSISDN